MGRGPLHRLHRSRRRQTLCLAALVAVVLLLGGCGGSASNAELCAQYDEVVATADDYGELDASDTSADELRALAKEFRGNVDELQEVAEGERIDNALSNLEATLDSARDAAAEAGDKADEKAAQAEESLQEVNEKWARVQALVADRCN